MKDAQAREIEPGFGKGWGNPFLRMVTVNNLRLVYDCVRGRGLEEIR